MVFWFFGFFGFLERESSFLGFWSLSHLSVTDGIEKLSSVPPHTRNDYIPCLKISGNKGQGSAEIPSKGVARKRAKRASAALATGFQADPSIP